jgi:hypothetical protein
MFPSSTFNNQVHATLAAVLVNMQHICLTLLHDVSPPCMHALLFYCVIPQVFLTPTHLCIVMEYAAGGELFDRIVKAGRFSEDEARYFFQQLICGVDYCHQSVSAAAASALFILLVARLSYTAGLVVAGQQAYSSTGFHAGRPASWHASS